MAEKAKESAAVKRARKKLKKRFEEQDKQVSDKALSQMKKAILTWLSRHSEERIPLENKEIALFDSNQHPAQTKSRFVQETLQKVKLETEASHDISKLAGRIKQ